MQILRNSFTGLSKTVGQFRFCRPALLMILIVLIGCASAPPEVARLHQKELEIIESLKKSHLAMVDSFIIEKTSNFETFFFNEYGPVFLNDWKETFKNNNGRDYDESRDFHILYNDLVWAYQEEIKPISKIRMDIRDSIVREYNNAIEAHNSIGGWINSVEKLNAANKEAIDGLLGSIKPGLSLDSINNVVEDAIAKTKAKIQ